MSRTNIVLDDKLVAKCLHSTGIKTRTVALVQTCAWQELLRHKNQKKILELKGKSVGRAIWLPR